MSSCSHLLSNRKQSAMSKRGPEGTSGEGSAMAKPRPVNLVSHSLVNLELDQSSVSSSARKMVRNCNQDPTAHSQAATRGHSIFGHQEIGAEW